MNFRRLGHGATVQNCHLCQHGMAWDTREEKHIPLDDYDFKYWSGIREDLLKICEDAVDGKWAPEVCKGNIITLMMEFGRERRMVWKLEGIFKEVSLKHVELKKDHEEVLGIAQKWDSLFERIEGKYPDIKIPPKKTIVERILG